MFVGIGIGINRQRFAGFLSAYSTRVLADGGLTEANSCVDGASLLLQTASLLLIPSGYKAAKIYSQVPTNGNGDLTWTRASDAWRTNANGFIQRVPWNLFTYSEEFDNVAWFKQNLSVIANQGISPQGIMNADILDDGNAVSTQHWIFQSPVLNNNITYTLSWYAKYISRKYMTVNIFNGSTTQFVTYDIQNGSILGSTGDVTATITDVGNGWYRCVYTRTMASTGSPNLRIALADDTGSLTYTGSNKQLYLWGTQLVEGSSAQTYFPTTDRLNVPRLSYMYGSCPALLLEPQRTNLALQSQTLDVSGTWVSENGTLVSANSTGTLSPDGSNTAEIVTLVSGTANQLYQTIAMASGSTYSVSIFLKNIALTSGQTFLFSTSNQDLTTPNQVNCTIDLANGTITSVGIGAGVTVSNVALDNYGNGWYRARFTFSFAVGGNNARLRIRQPSNVAYNTAFYAWGAQFESGSYTTTYIPTGAATATRLADTFNRANMVTNGYIGPSGSTWYVELRNNVAYARDSVSDVLGIGDSSFLSTNSLVIRNGGAVSRLGVAKRISGALTTLFTTTTDTVKIAIKWNGTSADVFVNGTKQVSASAFTTTNMEFLAASGTQVPTFIQAMALYPTPLSDAECITLTT